MVRYNYPLLKKLKLKDVKWESEELELGAAQAEGFLSKEQQNSFIPLRLQYIMIFYNWIAPISSAVNQPVSGMSSELIAVFTYPGLAVPLLNCGT